MTKAYYDKHLMQWFPIYEDETPFEREYSRYEKIIRYRDEYIKPIRFEHIPINGYTFTTEPFDPDRYYLIDENEDIYMFEEDLYTYLDQKFERKEL